MGRAAAAARSAAPATRPASRTAPTRWASASRGRNGRGPTAPSAIRASRDRPVRVHVEPGGDAHDRDRAAALQPELVPGLPAPVPGHDDVADQLAGPEDGAARPQEEGVERDRPLAARAREDDLGVERQERHDQVGARAPVREIPAERRLVPREEVGEVPRGVPERGQARRDEGRRAELPDRDAAADPRGAVLAPRSRRSSRSSVTSTTAPSLAPALAKVDQEVGPPGEGLRRRVLREERRGLGERRRAEVLEARQEHRYGPRITIGASMGPSLVIVTVCPPVPAVRALEVGAGPPSTRAADEPSSTLTRVRSSAPPVPGSPGDWSTVTRTDGVPTGVVAKVGAAGGRPQGPARPGRVPHRDARRRRARVDRLRPRRDQDGRRAERRGPQRRRRGRGAEGPARPGRVPHRDARRRSSPARATVSASRSGPTTTASPTAPARIGGPGSRWARPPESAPPPARPATRPDPRPGARLPSPPLAAWPLLHARAVHPEWTGSGSSRRRRGARCRPRPTPR